MNTRFRGSRPHAEAAIEGTQAQLHQVMSNSGLGRLTDMLGKADIHAERDSSAAARITIAAAVPTLDTLEAAAKAGRSMYKETCDRCGVVTSPAEPTIADHVISMLKEVDPDADPREVLAQLIVDAGEGKPGLESDDDATDPEKPRKGKAKK